MKDLPVSSSFVEKVTLPQRSSFRVDNEHTYLMGELEVRRHNGLFWRTYRKKTCVLLNTGHFLIYSSPYHGLSIFLPSLRNVTHRFSGNEGTGNEILTTCAMRKSASMMQFLAKKAKARCDVIMCQGHAKLGILIKGHRSLVTAWRRGIVCSHRGLPISEPHLTDELIWMQPTVNPEASESLICSLANRSLRLNNSMPSLVQTIFSQRRQSGLIGATLETQKMLTLDSMRSTLRHSHSFAARMPITKTDLTNKPGTMQQIERENRADSSSLMSDSGVWSPVSEEAEAHLKTPQKESIATAKEEVVTSRKDARDGMDWRQLTIAAKLPPLNADILNFEAAFSLRKVYAEAPVF